MALSLIRIPRVEHHFTHQQWRKIAHEIRNGFQRNRQQDDLSKCRSILRCSGRRTFSEPFNYWLELLASLLHSARSARTSDGDCRGLLTGHRLVHGLLQTRSPLQIERRPIPTL